MSQAVTLVVITKNAGNCLEKCLKSADWIENKIIVDSGSTDRTVEIAKLAGAKVIHQDWLGFGPQKQFAVMQAPTDWVLCLDADEFLSPELSQSLQSLFEQKELLDAYKFPRSNKFLGRFLKHGEGYPDWSLRLFNKTKARWSDDLVHEKVVAIGSGPLKVGKLGGDLMHESGESITHYIEKQNCYTDIQARQMIESGKNVSCSRLIFSPLMRFVKFYIVKRGFLDGLPGFVHIAIGCFAAFLKYLKVISNRQIQEGMKYGIRD